MIIGQLNIECSVKTLPKCYPVYCISNRNSLGIMRSSPLSWQPCVTTTAHLVCKTSLNNQCGIIYHLTHRNFKWPHFFSRFYISNFYLLLTSSMHATRCFIPSVLFFITRISFSEIKWNANWMQQCNLLKFLLARNVSGAYAHHQEH